METPTKPMTAREKIRKLVEVKEQVQREARERYQTDPEYRAIFERLKKENADNAPESSYKFVWIGGEHNVYAFTTNDEVGYEIRFVPSAYLFVDYVDQPVNSFEMVIAVADNPNGNRIPADPYTEPTIRAIFYDFFRSKEHVIVYIRDSSAGRQEARMRKFTNWYYKNIAVDLFKMDARLPDGDRFTLLLGILSKKHPYFTQFVELFKNLSEADK